MAFEMIPPDEITERDIAEVLEMESRVYDDDARQTLERCMAFFSVNNGIYLFFRDTESSLFVGNVNCMPVTDECYGMIRSGDFIERDIAPEMVLPEGDSVYFSGITIRESHRNRANLLRLMLSEFNRRTGGMRRMVADAVTKEGSRLCRMYGMERICTSRHGSGIYEKVFFSKR